jgi:hypothetical protein
VQEAVVQETSLMENLIFGPKKKVVMGIKPTVGDSSKTEYVEDL